MVKKMKRLDKHESRTVSKKCPECGQQCAIALRSCTKCSYSFTKARPLRAQGKPRSAAIVAGAKATKASSSSTSGASSSSSSAIAGTSGAPTETDLDKVGRRFRTKRMRPDFFNSLELDYASRTYRQRKPKATDEKDLKVKKKRGRPKGSQNGPKKQKEEKKKEDEEPLPELDDLYANFSQEKMHQFKFILDELNCKMSSTMFKPL